MANSLVVSSLSSQLRMSLRAPASRRVVVASLLVALCCAVNWSTTPQTAQALPVARMFNVKPAVYVMERKGSQYETARERRDLEFGDTVRAGKGASVVLSFVNGTLLTMKQNSKIQIEPPASNNSPLTIRVIGALSAVFVRPKGNTVVRAAAATAAARGTAFLVELPTDDSMVVTVSEDTVEFSNPQGSVLIAANEQSTAVVGSAPTKPVVQDPSGLIAWTADIGGLPVEYETPFITLDSKAVQVVREAQEVRVAANPNDAKSHEQLGQALYDLGEYAGAVAAYTRAVELSPGEASLRYGLGQARRGQGDAPGAIAEYQRALAAAPADAASRIGLALAYLSQGQSRPATEALKPIEKTPAAQAVAGLIALRQGKEDEAATLLRAAVAGDERLYQAHSLLALALLQGNDIPGALQAAKLAAGLQPESAQAQSTLSMVHFFAGQIDEAERAAKKAVELNPFSPFALLTQGRIYISRGQNDRGRQALQQAQALAPNLPLTHIELGGLYVRLDMLPRAEKSFKSALALDKNSADAHTGLGAVYYLTGKTDAAIAEHQEAIRLDPTNTTAVSNLAELYLREGNLVEARMLLEKASLDQPERGILYARLSEISLMRQELHDAQEFARRAVALLPASAVAHYQLGRVYLEQGRSAQAEQQFRQAVTLDRNFPEARYALGLTREIVETGRDGTRPSALPNPNRIGSAAASQNLSNLQSPGADERIKAAILDPTVVRVASRSYGNSQLDGILGEDGTRSLSLSHIQETGNRRGVRAITIEQRKAGIDRANSDTSNNRVSVILGQKASNSPSALFFLGQFDDSKAGLNRGNLGLFSAGAQERGRKPLVVLGGNLQSTQRSRTRFLLQYINPVLKTRGLLNGSETDVDLREMSAELRHDLQLSRRHLLSAGASVGRIKRTSEIFFGGIPGLIPDFSLIDDATVRAASAYIRNDFKVSSRFNVAGEVRVQKLDVDTTSRTVLPGPPTSTSANPVDKTSVQPSLIAEYQLNDRSGVRFRARRLVGAVEDFQLLSPTDVFLTSLSSLPKVGLINGSGRSFELEYDYTFRNASFLRLGVFDQHINRAQDLSVDGNSGAFLPRVRLRGFQAGYEGIVSRDINFYTNLNLNSAKDSVFNQYVANVPKWSAEAGFQYLNRAGWFVQPSLFYQDDRVRVDRTRASSVALINLRAGKRFGLRSVVFAEVVNLGNKRYDILEIVQPGRQFRIGLTQRF